MDTGPRTRPEYVGEDELQEKADRLNDALDVYRRFEEDELYSCEDLPSEVEGYLRELDRDSLGAVSSGIILATEIKHMTLELDELVGRYTEQHRSGNQEEWDEILDSTESARRAKTRAYRAGYQASKPAPGTQDFDEGCTVPREMSVLRLLDDEISFRMSTGSRNRDA